MGAGTVDSARLREAGATLALVDLDERAVLETLEAAGGPGGVARADVAEAQAVEEAVGDLASRLGPADVAVNNAGIAPRRRTLVHETSLDDWERVLAVNLTGAFLVSRAVLTTMVERGAGVIVNVASAAGLVALPGRSGYAASKGGLIQLTRTLAVEYAGAGIRANALCPGYIDTPLVREGLTAEPDRVAHLTGMIPMRRIADPDEIARAALFLASDRSSYMTGQTLVVDGGWTAL